MCTNEYQQRKVLGYFLRPEKMIDEPDIDFFCSCLEGFFDLMNKLSDDDVRYIEMYHRCNNKKVIEQHLQVPYHFFEKKITDMAAEYLRYVEDNYDKFDEHSLKIKSSIFWAHAASIEDMVKYSRVMTIRKAAYVKSIIAKTRAVNRLCIWPVEDGNPPKKSIALKVLDD